MNKINKFIVMTLAALLLQSCASQLQMSELQLYAQKTADVYDKAEFRKWDRLVKRKEAEVRATKVFMIKELRKKSLILRLIRAHQIMFEHHSNLIIDERYVDRKALQMCLVPKDTDLGRQSTYWHSQKADSALFMLMLGVSKRVVIGGVRSEITRVLSGSDIQKVIQNDLWNYVKCTESKAPGIVINDDFDWYSTELIWTVQGNILLNILARRAYMVITQPNYRF